MARRVCCFKLSRDEELLLQNPYVSSSRWFDVLPVSLQSLGLGLEDVLAAAAEDDSTPDGEADFNDDPVMRCDIGAEVAAQLRSFWTQDPNAFGQCLSYLTDMQRAAVQTALQ